MPWKGQTAESGFLEGDSDSQAFVLEGADGAISIASGQLRTPLVLLLAPVESVDAGGVSISAGTLRQIQLSYVIPVEGIDASAVTLNIGSMKRI